MILHVYVLLQVLLLGRTTAAYNTAVERIGLSPEENASLRQRLANTIFAQIFAGSPRERDGFIGLLLRAIVWITLAIAPILLVSAFQFSFLAYHSHIATWTHRLLILVELAAFFLIWPLALDARKDFRWPNLAAAFRRLALSPLQLIGSQERRRDDLLWLRQRTGPLLAFLLFLVISLSIASFPGEPHVNLFTGQLFTRQYSQCSRWIHRQFDFANIQIDLRFDRLNLPYVDVVDEDKLKKITQARSDKNSRPWEDGRTRDFQMRNFDCNDLSSADLRRVDLKRAHLVGTKLSGAMSEGASLQNAQLQSANLYGAVLKEANLSEADLQDADLSFAWLEGAELVLTQLQNVRSFDMAVLKKANMNGAILRHQVLDGKDFVGVDLSNADLRDAHLSNADLRGVSLRKAKLQGADLTHADLHRADLSDADLSNADLRDAHLSDANLRDANLQDTNVEGADLRDAVLTGTELDGHVPPAIPKPIYLPAEPPRP